MQSWSWTLLRGRRGASTAARTWSAAADAGAPPAQAGSATRSRKFSAAMAPKRHSKSRCSCHKAERRPRAHLEWKHNSVGCRDSEGWEGSCVSLDAHSGDPQLRHRAATTANVGAATRGHAPLQPDKNHVCAVMASGVVSPLDNVQRCGCVGSVPERRPAHLPDAKVREGRPGIKIRRVRQHLHHRREHNAHLPTCVCHPCASVPICREPRPLPAGKVHEAGGVDLDDPSDNPHQQRGGRGVVLDGDRLSGPPEAHHCCADPFHDGVLGGGGGGGKSHAIPSQFATTSHDAPSDKEHDLTTIASVARCSPVPGTHLDGRGLKAYGPARTAPCLGTVSCEPKAPPSPLGAHGTVASRRWDTDARSPTSR